MNRLLMMGVSLALIQFILGSRTIVSAPRQIGPHAYEVTLSDGTTWACFSDCDELLTAAKGF